MKISISNLILSVIFISITISMFLGNFQKLIFFEVDQTATTPATGTPTIKKLINSGFNGYKLVTSTHSNQFTFINNDSIGTIGYGGKVKVAPRVYGASSLADAKQLYESTLEKEVLLKVEEKNQNVNDE